ncbi:uncharacterized protein LOC113757111 [Coffea eugenioides]|uniref:uncharacterized protein LOC113757111 n=1 Tax=Coffea eugenioides TaxID=49369 RepID=UPI000F60B3E0|nr:uncharacterized protein LOC113757111 [Coffea eugenioides]
MRVLVWNCQGVGSPLTIPQLREVNNLSSPSMVFLSETKNRSNYMGKVKNILKFDEIQVVESMNKAGGIYASCDDQTRKQQWKVIQSRKHLWGDKWLIAGDFNDIVSNAEKWGGNRREEGSFKPFKDFINDNQLLEIGFEGHPWTWCNNWEGEGEIKQQMDRGLCSFPWYQLFQQASCQHCDSYASDHSILLFDTKPTQARRKKRFYFDKRWLQHQEIYEVVEQAWRQGNDGSRMYKVTQKIKLCRTALLKWRNKVQGNSKLKIDRIKGQLQELKECDISDKKERGKILKSSLREAYRQEEIYWSQKARLQWLKEGDKNTKFFHACVKDRRRLNRMKHIQRENGSWATNEEDLGTEIAAYYTKLFEASEEGDMQEMLNGIPHTITGTMNDKLTKPVGHLIKSVNHTIISLIPKVKNPTSLKQYRPISLCSTVYKIIAKILANRLKQVLHHCISKNQSAFIPRRQILDNIMLSHEFIHYLNNKRLGKDGFMAVKLDMSKAYDRVEWRFLDAVMNKMGFNDRWRRWIMECMSTVNYSFTINGQTREYVTPQRGIRQGDPLSPYLFLLCSEGLSSLLHTATEEKRIMGLKISRLGPTVSHLFFADDSLIFCKADPKNAAELRRILQVYEKGTGQMVNLEKSSVFFSKNVDQQLQLATSQALGDIQIVNKGRYLGLPMVVTRSKHQLFGYIKDNIQHRLQRWKNKLLSAAGKEVMLKAVAYALPTYTMSCFKIPKRMCKDINSIVANYWWGEANGRNKMHWSSWSNISRDRKSGGLGFKDLEAFNIALLGKQVWRLLTQPNLLVSKVLKARYFPKESIFNCKVPANASWIWKGLMGARKFMEGGIRRRIGNGKSTNIWDDCWIPDAHLGKVSSPKPKETVLHKVHDLIHQRKWIRPLIFATFSKQDAEKILNIPISLGDREDCHYWIHGTNGIYTVGSAYRKLTQEKMHHNNQRGREEASTSWSNQSQGIWKYLWKLKLCHTGLEVSSHPMGCNSGPPRNAREFDGKQRQPWKTVQKAQEEWFEFKEANDIPSTRSTEETRTRQSQVQLQEQGHNSVTLRLAIQVRKVTSQLGIGIICTGNFQHQAQGWALHERSSGNHLIDELEAVKLLLSKAAVYQFENIQVQLDNKRVFHLIQNAKTLDMRVTTLLEDILTLKALFRMCSFCLVDGDNNHLSNRISAYALNIIQDEEFVTP